MPCVSETFGLNVILVLNSIYFSSIMLLPQKSVLHSIPEYFTGGLKGMEKAVEQEKLFEKQI